MAQLSIYRLFEVDNKLKVKAISQIEFKEKFDVSGNVFDDLKNAAEKSKNATQSVTKKEAKYQIIQILNEETKENMGTYVYGTNLTSKDVEGIVAKVDLDNVKTLTMQQMQSKYGNNDEEENKQNENNERDIQSILYDIKAYNGKVFLIDKEYDANVPKGSSGRFIANGYSIATIPKAQFNIGKIGVALNFVEYGTMRLESKTYDVKRFRKRYIKQDGKVKIGKIGVAFEEGAEIPTWLKLQKIEKDANIIEFLKDKEYANMKNPVLYKITFEENIKEIEVGDNGLYGKKEELEQYELYRKANAIKKCAEYVIDVLELYKEDKKVLPQFSNLSKEYLDELYNNEGKWGVKLDITTGIVSEREPKGTPYAKDNTYEINYMERGWSVNPKGEYIFNKAKVDNNGKKITTNEEILNKLYNQPEIDTLITLKNKYENSDEAKKKEIKKDIMLIRDSAKKDEEKCVEIIATNIIASCIKGNYNKCLIEGFAKTYTKKDNSFTGKYEDANGMVISGSNGIEIEVEAK